MQKRHFAGFRRSTFAKFAKNERHGPSGSPGSYVLEEKSCKRSYYPCSVQIPTGFAIGRASTHGSLLFLASVML